MSVTDEMVEAMKQARYFILAPLEEQRFDVVHDLDRAIAARTSALSQCEQEPAGWISWAGGDFMPITGETSVWIQSRSGNIEGPALAREWAGEDSCWKHYGSGGDIIAYTTRDPSYFTHPADVRAQTIRECAESVQAAQMTHGNEREDAVSAILSLLKEPS